MNPIEEVIREKWTKFISFVWSEPYVIQKYYELNLIKKAAVNLALQPNAPITDIHEYLHRLLLKEKEWESKAKDLEKLNLFMAFFKRSFSALGMPLLQRLASNEKETENQISQAENP